MKKLDRFAKSAIVPAVVLTMGGLAGHETGSN